MGREVTDSGIPRIRSTFTLNWSLADWSASWTLRYLSALKEDCAGAAGFPICSQPDNTGSGRVDGTHVLGATTYNDVRVSWKLPVRYDMSISGGVNNVFAKDPPVCLSCSLNGYDASTYDLPGRFTYIEASLRF